MGVLMFGDGELEKVVSELSCVIRDAAWGACEWQDVCRSITDFFPGSFSALLYQNLSDPKQSFGTLYGHDEQHLVDYPSVACHRSVSQDPPCSKPPPPRHLLKSKLLNDPPRSLRGHLKRASST